MTDDETPTMESIKQALNNRSLSQMEQWWLVEQVEFFERRRTEGPWECVFCLDLFDGGEEHWRRCAMHPAKVEIAALEAERDALRADRDAVQVALLQQMGVVSLYAPHHGDCSINPCSCGLDAVLSANQEYRDATSPEQWARAMQKPHPAAPSPGG